MLVAATTAPSRSGIAEGRRILSNIRRVAKLFVVKSAFAATLILTVGLAGSAYPLLPRHLSLAALFTVGIPSFALALAPSRGPPAERDFVQGPAALLGARRRRLGARRARRLRRDEEPAGPTLEDAPHRGRDRAGADRAST